MYYVEALTQKRQAEWDRMIGLTTLPVISPEPTLTPSQRLAYRLNAAALSRNHLNKLIGWLVMHAGFEYDEARREVLCAGFPITADHTVQLITHTNAPDHVSGLARFLFPFSHPAFVRSLY